MLYFVNDYSEGAHPKVLEHIFETNMESLGAYGDDKYSKSAKEKIKAVCGRDDAEVVFLTGGTQSNQVVIDSFLKPYEGVIAAKTGHISLHEAGAIEYTGHKVIELDGDNGKLKACAVEKWLSDFYLDENHEHMTPAGLVYISHPTEYGTLYSKEELTSLSKVCRENGLVLYMDGARLGYGLMSPDSDITLTDVADLCDVFYIGGTKVGALCGEAIVFTHGNKPRHFLTIVKQHGALVAKGRIIGVQFDALFTDNLYFSIAKNAVEQAEKLRNVFKEKGYTFFIQNRTNQIFIVLENNKMEELKKLVAFSFWEKYDETHTVVRFATSWATTDEKVNELIEIL
ncbi:MAG: aminotransferase class I/II-fold pyridoxal phosphate-dependent enzyme [Oscillospiraceae bacterium]|nr:aminotransferase class I/II-fold pyridoxal phosphate-dependent enzyme [Oscillospiraceae bacterium]